MTGTVAVLVIIIVAMFWGLYRLLPWFKAAQVDNITTGGDWETSWTNGGRHVHFLPLRDGQHHMEAPDCHCGPTTQRFRRIDHSIGLLMVHHRTPEKERR